MAERHLLEQTRVVLEVDTLISRRRELPCLGEVLVQAGDRLEPADVVARCALEDHVLALDLARALGVGVDEVPGFALVAPGQRIEPTTLVAARPRRLGVPLRVSADVQGSVIGLQEGTLFVQSASRWVQLTAFVPGEVKEVMPSRGVIMQASGHVVHGIWGAGGEQAGILRVVTESPDAPLAWRRIGAEHYGMLLVAGTLQSALALRRAALHGVAGMVVGSLHPDLRSVCREMPFPVVVTEGMGRIPMLDAAFQILQEHDGSRAVLAGDPRLTASGPELLVPVALRTTTALPARAPGLAIGARVRLTGMAHLGATGQIVSLPTEPQRTETGAIVRGAWVRLADQRLTFVPLDNMELLAGELESPLTWH